MKKTYSLFLLLLLLAACSLPVDAPPPPTALAADTPTPSLTSPTASPPIPALTLPPTLTQPPPTFCEDLRPRELIQSLQTAIQTKDGALLAGLVSPTEGMDVIFIRHGNVINYDVEHAKFVFETTYQADWGLGAGSGAPVVGSFQEVILPSLQQVFTPAAILSCNDLKTGGVTYIPEWISPSLPYYSVHFPGTDQYSGMDWATWGVGMSVVEERYFLRALVYYAWEP